MLVFFSSDADTEQWARMGDVTISGGMTEAEIDSQICGRHDGRLNQFYTIVTCSQPIRVRFVQLLFELSTTGNNLYEVEVHGV